MTAWDLSLPPPTPPTIVFRRPSLSINPSSLSGSVSRSSTNSYSGFSSTSSEETTTSSGITRVEGGLEAGFAFGGLGLSPPASGGGSGSGSASVASFGSDVSSPRFSSPAPPSGSSVGAPPSALKAVLSSSSLSGMSSFEYGAGGPGSGLGPHFGSETVPRALSWTGALPSSSTSSILPQKRHNPYSYHDQQRTSSPSFQHLNAPFRPPSSASSKPHYRPTPSPSPSQQQAMLQETQIGLPLSSSDSPSPRTTTGSSGLELAFGPGVEWV